MRALTHTHTHGDVCVDQTQLLFDSTTKTMQMCRARVLEHVVYHWAREHRLIDCSNCSTVRLFSHVRRDKRKYSDQAQFARKASVFCVYECEWMCVWVKDERTARATNTNWVAKARVTVLNKHTPRRRRWRRVGTNWLDSAQMFGYARHLCCKERESELVSEQVRMRVS